MREIRITVGDDFENFGYLMHRLHSTLFNEVEDEEWTIEEVDQ